MSQGRPLVDWAVVGLGANLGDPERTFRLAVQHLKKVYTVVGASRLYRGPAMRLFGSSPQPDYVHGAVLMTGTLPSPSRIVDVLLDIERKLGRIRGEQWGPRVIDLDLLLTSTGICDEPRALVPHPGLTQRAFALRPLLELVPHALDPRSGASYRSVLDRLGPDELRVVGGTEWGSAT
jgi:2-amino-4-hydroxy-6-hydroxymethyldihydropteridine diphosphokinase